MLSLILEEQLKFLAEPHIEKESFVIVLIVQIVNHPFFLPNQIYDGGKIFNNGDNVGLNAYNTIELAQHKACIISFHHANIISGLGLAKYLKKSTLVM